MEHLKEKPGIILFEFYCRSCDKFFWTTIAQEKLTCPFCNGYAYINGEILIKDLKLYDEKDTITKAPSQNQKTPQRS